MHKRTTFAGLSGLLAAALLAAGCSDSFGPERRRPGAPAFQVSGNGIALDQLNGALNQSGTALIKGFNPTNPHLGDAIIATFFWLGSTNIIASVTDHLTNGTPVGNAYTLVEYVTADGISMATYVATNVQNFPDPNSTQDDILVVRATLSSSVTDGGAMISAYSGVNAVYLKAQGAHRSASGSGSSVTIADPGSILVREGALAYAVTMANGVEGVAPPPGFTQLGQGSDEAMKVDGEYLVQASEGSVDPQWTWFFNSSRTWLATVLALNVEGFEPSPTQLAFTVQPSRATALTTIAPPVQVVALNEAGNIVPSFSGPITIALGANPSGGSLSGTTTVAAVNGVATFSDLSIDRAGNGYTLQASGSGLTGATSAAFDIAPPRLAFTVQPSTATALTTIAPPVQVVALDEAGNTVGRFSGTITIALGANPSGGTLSGTTTVAAVNGVATFSDLSIDQAGNGYTLQASGSGVTGATSAVFDIAPPQLVFTVQPSTTLPFFTIQPAVEVTAVDLQGRPVARFTGPVTIAIGRNGGLLVPGTLSGTKTVAALNGVARFADLSIDQAGNGYTLRVTASSAIGAESAPFNIGLF